jgi:alkylated DNA repair dioxygenase AlkB
VRTDVAAGKQIIQAARGLRKRRVVSFGWHYDYSGRALRESTPIPSFLSGLRNLAAEFARVPADFLQQAMVTEYAPGAGIGWHRDKPIFEDVVAFSFVSQCRLRFRLKDGDRWKREVAIVAPRSVYLLRGPARIRGITAFRRCRRCATQLRYAPISSNKRQGVKPKMAHDCASRLNLQIPFH